ncbi:MAG TPA: IS701 family transposase [Gemmataceae bacterium]
MRTLQEFLRDHRWDAAAARDRLQRDAAGLLPTLPADDLGTVGVIDETGVRKQGDKTPGVARQYLGCAGKVENGIVTVHLGVCRGAFKALIDADLYLPRAWDEDRPRCRAAGIPDDLAYRPKWQIALGQIDRARGNGVTLDWLTFDAEYGKRPGFVAGLRERGPRFVGEVPRALSCLAVSRAGRRPDGSVKARPAEEVVRVSAAFRSRPWRVLRLARETLGEQVWRFKAARVWLHDAGGWSGESYWLVWASDDRTGEEKFFLADAPAGTGEEVLVRVGFRRAGVEHAIRVAKSELGFAHFEGRSYVALMRHLSLCLAASNFAAAHAERLRGEKSAGDGGAGLPGAGVAERALAGAAARDGRAGVRAAGDRLPPGAKPGGAGIQAEAPRRGAVPEEPEAPKKKTAQPVYGKLKVAL